MVRIITDSASDFRGEEIEKLGITVIPMHVQFGEETYRDGVDLSPKEFFNKLIESDALPTTSQISPIVFEELFEEITKAGDTAVVVLLSSELSGTYQNAAVVARDYPGICVFDSQSVTIGEQCFVHLALKLREEGKTSEEILSVLEGERKRLRILALLDTLEYLKKGGRISPSVAFVGGVLAIKPVVTVVDGKVELIGKARGSKNGNNLLMELTHKCGGIDFNSPLAIGYTGVSRVLLDKYIEDSKVLWEGKIDNLPIIEIGPTIGTHVGPGAIAIAFFENREV